MDVMGIGLPGDSWPTAYGNTTPRAARTYLTEPVEPALLLATVAPLLKRR
jgi:hypothetical protein